MSAPDFEIYETERGHVAVTNEVRRAILAALAKKDRMLPELVKLTRKAKPTLSSVHMRELLAQKLVDELPHPTDKRKKIYRLRGRRVVPPGAANGPERAGLALALEGIAAAPVSAPESMIRAQAKRLGALCAGHVAAATPRESVTALAGFLEREAVARALRLDLEALSMDLEVERSLGHAQRAPLLLAAWCEGALAELAGEDARAKLVEQRGRRVVLQLPGGWGA